MVSGKIIHFFSFFLMGVYGTAYANITTLGDLDKLQSERFYYEAKAAANKAKRDADGDSETHADNTVASLHQQKIDTLPSLIKINGGKANIALPDGTTRTVTTGELLLGGRYQVVSINLEGVKIRRLADGKQFPLN